MFSFTCIYEKILKPIKNLWNHSSQARCHAKALTICMHSYLGSGYFSSIFSLVPHSCGHGLLDFEFRCWKMADYQLADLRGSQCLSVVNVFYWNTCFEPKITCEDHSRAHLWFFFTLRHKITRLPVRYLIIRLIYTIVHC